MHNLPADARAPTMSPLSTRTGDPSGATSRIRAVVFDRDLRSSEVDPRELQAQFPLADSMLVWWTCKDPG